MSSCITLSILIISYNTREMTLACLRSVLQETRDTDFEIIVVDNASVDGSAAGIAGEFGSRVQLFVSERNLGFAAANNQAALAAKGTFLLLLNPDTVILDRAIDRLISFAYEQPYAGIWGGRTLFCDGSLNPSSCWSRQTFWSLLCQAFGLNSLFRRSSLFNPEGIGGWNREGCRAVDIVSGCFLLIRRDDWLKLDGFKAEFFMYGEEADLCLRAAKFDMRPMVSSSATIIHFGGGSEKIKSDKIVRLLTAKMRLIQYHFPDYARKPGCFLLSLWPVGRFIGLGLMGLLGIRSAAAKSAVWGEVVRRRREWFI